MDKNSISFLSDLFNSYLIDKDSRFASIASGLTDSVMKVYGQGKPTLPSTSFDGMLKYLKLDYKLKGSYYDVYSATKFIMDYKKPPGTNLDNFFQMGMPTAYQKPFYTALAIAQAIAYEEDIKKTFFPNNDFLNFLYTGDNLSQTIMTLNSALFKKNIPQLFLKSLAITNANAKDIMTFFNTIMEALRGKKEEVKKDKPSKIKPTKGEKDEDDFTKDDYSKILARDEYIIAFDKGLASAEKHFPSYGTAMSATQNANIDKIINDTREQLYNYIVRNNVTIKAISVEKFTNACYMVLALKTINYRDRNEINDYYQAMDNNFRNWNKIHSLAHLDKEGDRWGGLNSEKAGEIYIAINSVIIRNIINSIPKEYQSQLTPFIDDLKNGYLTNIFGFCKKYSGIIGNVDSAKLVQADYFLSHLGNNNVNTCARLILQEIEAHNIFRQTAKDPSFVEPLKDLKTPEDIAKNKKTETKEPFDYKNNISIQEWLNPETIKMAGVFLYKLNLIFNEIRE